MISIINFIFVLLSLIGRLTDAFTPSCPSANSKCNDEYGSRIRTTTELSASSVTISPPRKTTKRIINAIGQRRRDFFDLMRKNYLVLGSAAAEVRKIRTTSTITCGEAFAAGDNSLTTAEVIDEREKIPSSQGRSVECRVNNLEGISGNTGTFKIELHPEWAPRGVERFEELTKSSFWDGCRVFRVIPGLVSQFGINGDPEVQSQWRSSSIRDDPVKKSNSRGTVVFGTAGGTNSRTTQVFINTGQVNDFLDEQGFAPIGIIDERGMEIVDKFYGGYSNNNSAGNEKPNQGKIQQDGNTYLRSIFPKLTYISQANIL